MQGAKESNGFYRIQDTIQFSDRKQHVTDGLDFENIAELLNEYGVSKRGKAWTRSSVYNVIHKKKRSD